MRTVLFLFCVTFTFIACEKNEDNPPVVIDEKLYFPPVNSDTWQTTDPADLNWNTEAIPDLITLLKNGGTRAFIVLKDGKIVIEEYFGKDLLGLTDFNKDKKWYWASAGKTLTAFAVGKAAEQGQLDINQKTSDFLGEGWTSLTSEEESKITVWNQLTMTSGLDDKVQDNSVTTPDQLIFKADSGTRWAYHNAPYTLLQSVISNAVGQDYNDYFDEILTDKIGLDGYWQKLGNNHVYFSNARSMARYGLLILNNGTWDETELLNADFVSDMVNTSQDLNKSYGYLWWLNGKETYMLPGLQLTFQGKSTPNAPDDMFSGMGKNGQYLCVIPSQNMVLLRLGENPDNSLVPIQFIDDIWGVMNDILP